jgi:predicted dehydrogenase
LRRHRVLIIGAGSIGERHLRCFRATDRAEVSFVEIYPALRAEVAARYDGAAAYADLDAALAAGPPQVAVVATPAPSHIPIAMRLVAAGADVLIEKPLSISDDGIAELRALVRERGAIAGVAYVYRSHPVLKAMHAAVVGGRFGRPVELVAVAGQHFPTYRPAYRSIYYNDHATGGGAIQDALTHLLNAGEWLVGPINRVVADAAHLVLEGVTVEDTAHVLARHGEVLASYSLNQHQAPNEVTLTVVCERGTARFEGHSQRWRWATEPGGEWHDETFGPLERDALFVAQAAAFLDAVEARSEPVCTLDAGWQTLRGNLATLASVRDRAWHDVRAAR